MREFFGCFLESHEYARLIEFSCSPHQEFDRQYGSRYGFLMPERRLIVESLSVEAIGESERIA